VVATDDIDPRRIRNLHDLAMQLRYLRLRAGNPSLRELERWAAQESRDGRRRVALPRSSVADALAGVRLPPLRLVLAFVEACGIPPEELPEWAAAWERVARSQLSTTMDGTSTLGTMPIGDPVPGRGLWQFDDGKPITIVCSLLPERLRVMMPYADPNDPDYVEMYTRADPDALFDLYGHVRAVNPTSPVAVQVASALAYHHYTTHLVLLGGVDWNVVTRDLLDRLELPVHQVARVGGSAYFEAVVEDQRLRFPPVLRKADNGRLLLIEDVAHLFRGPNPFNRETTITMCNGMFSRGTLGAVRILTDADLRERNEAYLHSRFAGQQTFSLLARVRIVNGEAVTPDITVAENRLHEFP
jgi:hypothetical protein